jgi:concentrative nucleoside transporter, CNT family
MPELMLALQSAVGVLVLLGLCWLMSEDRRQLPWRLAVAGLAIQLGLAILLLKVPPARAAFAELNRAVDAIQAATRAGTGFVFGYLGGGPTPFAVTAPEASFVLALQALPLVLVVSALSAVLTYWRVLPVVVKGFAWALERSMGVGGAVGVSTAANVFLGTVEAPLMIRPYIGRLSRSELFVVMTGGMAGIAGTVMVLYASLLRSAVPDALSHILVASILSAPAAILVAKLMIPEKAAPTPGELIDPDPAHSTMDAITKGTADGVHLLIQIIALLVVLVALVHLANQVIGLLPDLGGAPLTLQRMLGWIMAPVVWLVGVPWSEAPAAGQLMGTKTVLNEFLAYLDLARLTDAELSPRSRLLMTYALCGFANFASIGIMLGGLIAMAPQRRHEMVQLAGKSLVSGTLATCVTAAVIGIVV